MLDFDIFVKSSQCLSAISNFPNGFGVHSNFKSGFDKQTITPWYKFGEWKPVQRLSFLACERKEVFISNGSQIRPLGRLQRIVN